MFRKRQDDYSSLQHIFVSLHGDAAASSPPPYVMLSAYFDDSGKAADSPVVILCGFVAPFDQWLAFERDRKAVLSRPEYGGITYFHMKEVRRGRDEFAQFRDNPELVKDLLERLQRLIRVRVTETFGCCLVMQDYETVNREYRLDEYFGPPLVMAAGVTLTKLMSWQAARKTEEQIQVVLDQGMDHWGSISDGFYGRYGFRPLPGNVPDVPGLQAGDFVAWELRRAMADVATKKVSYWNDLRGQFMNFLQMFSPDDGKSVRWYLLDDEELRNFAVNGDVQKREQS